MILKDGRMLAVGCEKGWTCIFSLEKPIEPLLVRKIAV